MEIRGGGGGVGKWFHLYSAELSLGMMGICIIGINMGRGGEGEANLIKKLLFTDQITARSS